MQVYLIKQINGEDLKVKPFDIFENTFFLAIIFQFKSCMCVSCMLQINA